MEYGWKIYTPFPLFIGLLQSRNMTSSRNLTLEVLFYVGFLILGSLTMWDFQKVKNSPENSFSGVASKSTPMFWIFFHYLCDNTGAPLQHCRWHPRCGVKPKKLFLLKTPDFACSNLLTFLSLYHPQKGDPKLPKAMHLYHLEARVPDHSSCGC